MNQPPYPPHPPHPPHGIDRNPIKYLVLAGNYREFRNWLMDNEVHPQDALFVNNASVLWGRKFQPEETSLTVLPSFNERADAEDILQIARTRFIS